MEEEEGGVAMEPVLFLGRKDWYLLRKLLKETLRAAPEDWSWVMCQPEEAGCRLIATDMSIAAIFNCNTLIVPKEPFGFDSVLTYIESDLLLFDNGKKFTDASGNLLSAKMPIEDCRFRLQVLNRVIRGERALIEKVPLSEVSNLLEKDYISYSCLVVGQKTSSRKRSVKSILKTVARYRQGDLCVFAGTGILLLEFPSLVGSGSDILLLAAETA